MDQTPNEATHLIERLRAGDRQALGELFDRYRERLRRMVELRMDPQTAGPPRCLGRPPGGLPRAGRRSRRLPRRPQAAAPALDAAARRPAADHAAPAAPGHPACGTPGWRSRSIARRCPRPAPRPWPRCSWGGTPRPPRRPSAPSGCSGSRKPSIRSTRSTARSWPCGTSSSSAAPRRPKCWGSVQEAGAKRYFRALKRLKEVLASMPGGWEGI